MLFLQEMLIWSFWGAIYIPFFVRLLIPNAWNCHSLYTAFSSNVGAWGMWACSLFLSNQQIEYYLVMKPLNCEIFALNIHVLEMEEAGAENCFCAKVSKDIKMNWYLLCTYWKLWTYLEKYDVIFRHTNFLGGVCVKLCYAHNIVSYVHKIIYLVFMI